jgi:membrane-bound serine protease (ClpP class)
VKGITGMMMGSLFLQVEPVMPTNAFRDLAVVTGVIGTMFVGFVIFGVLNIRRFRPVHGNDEFRESRAQVTEDLNPEGRVKVQGEIWRASSRNGELIARGQRVNVVGREGMYLIVEPLENRISEKDGRMI